MKKYHLTFIRDGVYHTAFAEILSIWSFLKIEEELGRVVHIIYSREVDEDEWNSNKINPLGT